MLNIRLDPETEAYLAEILQYEKTTPDELIQILIRQRWLRLHPKHTLVERRGGHPEYLLQDAAPDRSEQENRKQAIASAFSRIKT